MNAALILVVSALFACDAWAGCEKDTDCKGDRVCESGMCVAPAVESPRPALRSGSLAAEPSEYREKRGRAGAIAIAKSSRETTLVLSWSF